YLGVDGVAWAWGVLSVLMVAGAVFDIRWLVDSVHVESVRSRRWILLGFGLAMTSLFVLDLTTP
ncbi:MAG: hypothetical protein KDC98_24675, partial [Planctomycetes bacterium]|nr:hypothetical protein [Planctomycetota bacterium]